MSDLLTPSTLRTAAKWSLYLARSVKISYPLENHELPVGEFEVRGTFRLRMGGDFILCHRHNAWYWPHGRVHFQNKNRVWTSKFTIAEAAPSDNITIQVVELNEACRALVDFYYQTMHKTGYQPIEMCKVPSGFTVFDEVTVRRKKA